ncbi:hypothetical protein D9M73_118820 [compost metagenome]
MYASGGDDAARLARSDQRAREGHAALIGDAGGVCDGLFLLFDRHGFAGERRLVDQQAACTQQAQIRRNPVARFEHHDIAGHEIRDRDHPARAVAQYGRVRGDHVANGAKSPFGLAFLGEADDRVDQDHDRDDKRIDKVAEQSGCKGSGKQEIDERAVELGEEAQDRMRGCGARKRVRPMLRQSCLRFALTEPGNVGVQPVEHRVCRQGVPGFDLFQLHPTCPVRSLNCGKDQDRLFSGIYGIILGRTAPFTGICVVRVSPRCRTLVGERRGPCRTMIMTII